MRSIKLGPNSKIKEDDLIQALEQNQIMGYGTDIVDQQSSLAACCLIKPNSPKQLKPHLLNLSITGEVTKTTTET